MASACYIKNWLKNNSIENNFNLPEDSVWNDLFSVISERPEALESACLSILMIESSLGKIFLD